MQSEAPPCTKVPTVDLGELGAHHAEEPSQQEWDRVMHEIDHAFSSIGCAYITGHGIPDHLINEMLSCGVDFFNLDKEAKIRWAEDLHIHGYVSNDAERWFGDSNHELHESFLFKRDSYDSSSREGLPFMTPLVSFHQVIHDLYQRLMITLAHSVGQSRDYFLNMHLDSGTKKSPSCYRLNYYPFITGGRREVTGFGAHSDKTTISLLFSNDSKGLQVCDSAGQWMDVPFVPGTVLLLAGEFIHYYSNKRFKPVMHRVVLPDKYQQGRPPRCSLGYFLHPDSHHPMWPPSNDLASPAPPSVKDYLIRVFQAVNT